MKRAIPLIGTLRTPLRTQKAPGTKKHIGRLAVFLICLFVSSQAWSQIQVKNYPEAKSSSWFKTYIRGVGVGIRLASIPREHPLAMYCPPGTFTPDADEYIAILDRQILDESSKPGGLKDDTTIEFLLLRGLFRKYPCHR